MNGKMPGGHTLRAYVLGFAALILLAAGAGWYVWPLGGRAPAPPAALYSLSFPDANGTEQALSQWKGKVLVVNFWATWCAPCVAEMPELEALQNEFSGRNVAIVGLGAEAADRVGRFRDQLGLHLVLLAGGFQSIVIARNLGDNQGVLPYTAVFSADGALLHTQVGALRPGQLRAWLDAAASTAPGSR